MLVSLSPTPLPHEEQVSHREHNTTAFVNQNNAPIGKGSLIIAKHCLSWVTDEGQGFTLQYPMIALHAISRDLTNFGDECLYLMVEDEDNNSDTESVDGNDSRNNEIRFVPDDKTHLEAMYKAMSECQALHPDPNESFSDDDNDDHNDDDDNDIPLNANVYDVAAAEDSRGLPHNLVDDNFENGNQDEEPMEVMGQFDDAEHDL